MEKNSVNYGELLDKYGSPLYVYKEDVLRSCCQKLLNFKRNLEESVNVKINMHYSTKANNNPAILKVVKEYELGVDCMSLFELDIDQKCGFEKNKILYVCNNVDKEEMRLIHESGVLICLDSISQIETWGKNYPETDILIRINPGVRGVGHSEEVITSGKKTKFGITEANFQMMFNTIAKYKLNLVGIHQHLGSCFLNDKIDNYIDGIKHSLDMISRYPEFSNIRVLDLGGGFGVPYQGEAELDFEVLERKLSIVLNEFLEKNKSIDEIKFEPGRFIPCQAGVLVGRVTALKHENGIYWIGTDIGMNQLVRPSMYDSYHEIEIIGESEQEILANICGNICESGDVLGKNRIVRLPKVGDVILVYNAGAYGYSMASNYTGRLRPAEIIINDTGERMIRKRETIDYIEQNIIW